MHNSHIHFLIQRIVTWQEQYTVCVAILSVSSSISLYHSSTLLASHTSAQETLQAAQPKQQVMLVKGVEATDYLRTCPTGETWLACSVTTLFIASPCHPKLLHSRRKTTFKDQCIYSNRTVRFVCAVLIEQSVILE